MYAEAAKQEQGRRTDLEPDFLANPRGSSERSGYASEQAAAAVALSQICDRALSVRASLLSGLRLLLSVLSGCVCAG